MDRLQGCQMVCFQTIPPVSLHFGRPLDRNTLCSIWYLCFVAIRYIIRILVYCIKKKLATLIGWSRQRGWQIKICPNWWTTRLCAGWQYRWCVLDDISGLFSYYTSKRKMVRGVRRGCVRLHGAVVGIDDEVQLRASDLEPILRLTNLKLQHQYCM
jgi:hypothetical protein